MNNQGIWPPDARLLLQGERVEVRQKEKGLRGSWHPATIVGLKPGRRLVEYDELLTEDGLHKLRESIPLTKSSEAMRSAGWRTTFSPRRSEAFGNSPRRTSVPSQPKSRGFLRPLPPPCTENSPRSWNRGFMVDVLFQDAWWEAVLLEDVVSFGDDAFINVLFPDEGDEERVSVRDLRISQEWNEETGQWSVKGICNLSALLRKKMDLSNQNKPGNVTALRDNPVPEGESKGCGAERDHSCSASTSSKVLEGSRGNHQLYQVIASDVSGDPSNGKGIGGELLGGHAIPVEQVALANGTIKENDMNKEPVQDTCLEHCGDIPSFKLGSCTVDGFSGVRGDAFCKEEDGPVENLGPHRDTDGPENVERSFDGDGLKNCSKDGREEVDMCTHGGGGGSETSGILAKKPLIEADIQPDCRGLGEEDSGSIVHEQALELINPPLSATIAGLQEPADDTSTKTISPRTTDIGSDQCLRNLCPLTESELQNQGGEEASVEGTDPEAKFSSPHSIQEGDPLLAHQVVAGDEAVVKKKVGRPSKYTEGIRNKNVLSESDGTGKAKAGSKEERLNQGLMSKEIPSPKSRVREGGSSSDPKAPVKEMNSMQAEYTEGLDDSKVTGRRDGKQRSCANDLVQRTDDSNGKAKKRGRPAKSDQVLDTLRQCSRLVKTEGATSGFFKPDPRNKTARVRRLKEMVRDVAKEALQEAGFRIEFRPRREKDYEDPVYVSPEGRTYWSIPNAWRAWKKSQGLEGQMIPKHPGSTGAVFCRPGGKGKAEALGAKVGDKGQDSDKDILLQAAVEQVGTLSIGDVDISQSDLKRLHLTNCQVADLFLEDFCALKRTIKNGRPKGVKRPKGSAASKELTTKGLVSKNGVVAKTARQSLAGYVNEGSGKKRKRDGQTSTDSRNRKIHGFILKKHGKVSKDRGPLTKVDRRLLLKPGLPGYSSKKLASKYLDRQRPFVKPAKGGKRPSSDGSNGFECEPSVKKMRGTPRQSTLADGNLTKRQRALLQHYPPLCQSGKKSKAMPGKQLVLQSRKQKNQKARSGLRLEVRPAASRNSDGSDSSLFGGKQTVLSWMIDRGAILEKERVSCVNGEDNQVLKKGFVSCEGIFCSCCKRVYTIHEFEVHAGAHARRPGQDIIFAQGGSFTDCQQQAWAAEMQLRKTHNYVGVTADDRNDDTCSFCGDGGDLLCCDHCPSTFHTSCLQIKVVPEGDWHCPKCSCAACLGSLHNDEKDLATNERLLCSQCEHRYHSHCLYGSSIVDGSELFCGKPCQKIFAGLRNIVGISHPLDKGFSWTLLRCMEGDRESPPAGNVDAITEQHSKLAVALLVMQECFVPMEDPRTNIDMITHVLYNRRSEFDRLNYGGFYTAILERGDEIVSAASVRFHGGLLAEMPLIGTRQQYRRQGMCRLLVSQIEKVLQSLEVATFVLPAIPELLETWTYAFGFQPLDASERLKHSSLSMMVFPGTQLLQKTISVTDNVDTVLTESSLSQKTDSCLEALQSKAVPIAGDDKDANICYPSPGTSISPSDMLDCRIGTCSAANCAASGLDPNALESRRDSDWQSCTEKQGPEEFCLSKVDGRSLHCEFVNTSNLCTEKEASKDWIGLQEEHSGGRIEMSYPGPVLPLNRESNSLETCSRKVLEEPMCQQNSHDDLNSDEVFSESASPCKMSRAEDSPKMSQPLSQRNTNAVSRCGDRQPDESTKQMGSESTCIEDQGIEPCSTIVDEEPFEQKPHEVIEDMWKENVDLFGTPRVDRYLFQTYGRKRWRQGVNANSPVGSQINSDALVLGTAKGSLAIDEADAMSSVCFNFDKKHLSDDSGICQ